MEVSFDSVYKMCEVVTYVYLDYKTLPQRIFSIGHIVKIKLSEVKINKINNCDSSSSNEITAVIKES